MTTNMLTTLIEKIIETVDVYDRPWVLIDLNYPAAKWDAIRAQTHIGANRVEGRVVGVGSDYVAVDVDGATTLIPLASVGRIILRPEPADRHPAL